MKWFVATNESSLINDDFFMLLKVAVLSAIKNTSLTPYLVYEGRENDRLAWLENTGVKILRHKLSIREEIEQYIINNSNSSMINVRTGAYLRSEIPQVIRSNGINDQFVLYTDCDVVFMRNPDFSHVRPKFFAASGHKNGGYTPLKIGGWMHFNSGVMVINVDGFCQSHDAFIDFVLKNGNGIKRPPNIFFQKNLFMSDQVAYNLFYRGRISRLDRKYNWHPTMGINDDAVIIHFNGLKWTQWDDFIQCKLTDDVMDKFTRLVNRNRDSFEYYVKVALGYAGSN